jgi:transcriptional regulator with XRE-family HTH domain
MTVSHASNGAAEETLRAIGLRLRNARRARDMTLKDVAEASGISTSMLSLLERGRVSPSLGSLIDVCLALKLPMSQVIEGGESTPREEVVVHSADRHVFEHAKRVVRQILLEDHKRGVSIAIAEFPPNSDSTPTPHSHGGHEYGYVLEGKLTVEVDGQSYSVGKGDLISYSSRSRHRIWNHGKRPARTLWLNVGLRS